MTAGLMLPDSMGDILERVRSKFSLKPRVAFAGFGKAGKSSLLNAIYGTEVARVSMRTDETASVQTAERFGIDFTDTPGIGTAKFSLERVLELGVLERQHVVVHVLNGASAVTRDDERLSEAIRSSPARGIAVVNKADLLEPRERDEFRAGAATALDLLPEELLFVSAKRGEGLSLLVERILAALPAAMHDAFIGQQRADWVLKRRRVRALVLSKASVCAGVALAPIPIADILVLTPIQIAMVTTIGYLYGVEVTSERAAELLAVVGAGFGLREAARQIVKLVPGFGSAVSAAVAFAGTVALGETAELWFSRSMSVDPAELRSVFANAAEAAQRAFSRERDAARGSHESRISALRGDYAAGRISREEFDRALAELSDR